MNWLEIWYQAAGSEHGVVVEVTDLKLAIQRLYQARSKSGDLSLNEFGIKRSPFDPNQLWIVRLGKKIERTPGEQTS